jgi:hypothetical protein
VLPAPDPDDPDDADDPDDPAEPAGLQAEEPGDADGPLDKIDALVQPASEPENAVLVDEARVVRWTGPLFAVFSLILLPWTVYLGETLPSRQLSPHYDIAWAGFDVILLIGLAGTAYFALRRSRYLAISAAATAALLIVDAWFDVLTTPASQRAESILLAAVVELPLAAVCIWLSLHTEQLQERRITLLLRRHRLRRHRLRRHRPSAARAGQAGPQ